MGNESIQHATNTLREHIQEVVHLAKKEPANRSQCLRIVGGNSKAFLKTEYSSHNAGNNPATIDTLNTRALNGIVDYQASELVVTVAAGTPLIDLQGALAEQGQYLPFDAPMFGEPVHTTVGGAVAAGLAGPRRASYGSLRDFVLGVTIIDGQGRLLRFGGQVIKNVAGYDVSRLLCGSWGQWALMTQVSLRTLPLPKAQMTVEIQTDGEAAAIRLVQEAISKAFPIAATCVSQEGYSRILLSGNKAAVTEGKRFLTERIFPQTLLEIEAQESSAYWNNLKNHHPPVWPLSTSLQPNHKTLWRVALPPFASASLPILEGHSAEKPDCFSVEWHGSLRWLRASWSWAQALAYRQAINAGSIMCFAPSPSILENVEEVSPVPVLAYIPEPQRSLLIKIKSVFDPYQLFV